MRGRKILREPLDPNLTPPWRDPPEPPPECEVCEGYGRTGEVLCPVCGGTGEKP